MRILLACPYYPPETAIAAIRVGKFAQYWAERGHEVTVLCREPLSFGLVTPDNPGIKVVAVRDPLASASRLAAAPEIASGAGALLARSLRAGKAMISKLIWPDFYGPWAIRALQASKRIPSVDVVVASCGPFSTLLLGATLARRHRVPLVVDYRDLLAFGTYYDHGVLRTAIDKRIERRIVRRAALLAGVSRPMALEIDEYASRRAIVVTNGFEPSDFSGFSYRPTSSSLRIVYCGQIYPGRRDPQVLFQAVSRIAAVRPDLEIQVDFYGRGLGAVMKQAEAMNIERNVTYRGEVTHRESLEVQAGADLLLLLLWNDPGERSVLTGKLFEYMGAGRPILMLGLEDGAAAELIRQYELGFVSNDIDALVGYLVEAAETKLREGSIAGPPPTDLHRFTRESQSGDFLVEIQRVVESDEGTLSA